MLLLLLAGPQLHRQRERNISADDGGAGRRARSTGAVHKIQASFLFLCPLEFSTACADRFDSPCFTSSSSRSKSSRVKSLRASCSASKEGWLSTQGREKRKRKTHRVSPDYDFSTVVTQEKQTRNLVCAAFSSFFCMRGKKSVFTDLCFLSYTQIHNL